MPASDPVTAIAGALAEGFATARPLIENWLAHRNDNERRARLEEWQTALRGGNIIRIAAFTDRLLLDAGQPVTTVGDTWVKVPIEYIDELVQMGIGSVHQQRELADLLAAIKRA